jgi:MFS family permease
MAEKFSVDDIFRKYGSKIEQQIQTSKIQNVDYSRDYSTFKKEMAPELDFYEKLCREFGKLIKINISEKDKLKIQKHIEIAHLDIEAWQSTGLAVFSFLTVFFIGLLSSLAVVLIKGGIGSFPLLYFLLMTIFSVFLFYFVQGYPSRLANNWRLKASSQMVPAILYIVVYMRHTPNLEKAIAFASEHLQYPLSLDFKKVFYNVQTGKFSTIKESLDNYLEIWRDYNIEFIESFHLIESSLFEPDNSRRISILEKSLQVVLDGVYDKMLKFTHDVRSPLTNVYMLGVVLPTLGLALLPLASAMIGEYLRWYHVLILFNLIVPFLVFYLTDKVMLDRPGGYGETELLEKNPFYSKYKSKRPYLIAGLICLPLFLISLIPLVSLYFGFPNDFSFFPSFFGETGFFDFINGKGPFGLGALILSMFFPLGICFFFAISSKYKTREIIEYRKKTKQLEKEFNSSLFQLGNRLGNGVPPELAFGKVAESSKGLMTGEFFKIVNYNITKNGMSVDKSIFDKRRGAIIYFPSELIATSMKILVESSKKGLKIAAVSLMSISEYLKNIEKINMRLRDMLAEVISDMKSNMTFLAPLLSGVVVGLASMITTILGKLEIDSIGSAELTGFGSIGNILDIFLKEQMIPPYFLQIIVGIYIIEIIFILTRTLVVVDSGEDKLETTRKTGQNLIRGGVLYFIVALVSTLALSLLATIVLGGL